jgi:hypothetical protein
MSIIDDTATAATRQHDTMTPGEGGAWVSLAVGAELLGISLRTLQRRAKAGAVVTRQHDDGSREVLIPRHVATDATTVVVPLEASGTRAGRADAATPGRDTDATAAIVVAQAAIEGYHRQIDRLEAGAARSRRLATAGWTAAAAMGVLAAAGAVWGVVRVGAAERQAATADASRALLEQAVEREASRADALLVTLTRQASEHAPDAPAESVWVSVTNP